MPAKSKKSVVSSKSHSKDTNIVTTSYSSFSSSQPTLATAATRNQALHDHRIPVPGSIIALDELDQRSNPPYQGQAPLRQIHQSPNLSNSHNQPPYGVQGVYSQNSGIQSPYLGHPANYSHQQQPPNENTYFSSHPSPRSSTSTAYYQPEKADSMAATATMHRPPYPPIYHTPQSNSPASVTSPQTHDHGRPMFAPQQPQMSQPMYAYGPYQPLGQMHHSPYGSHQQSPMSAQPMLPNQYNANQLSHGQVPSHSQSLNTTSPQMKHESNQQYAQTPQQRSSMLGQQQPTPGQTPGSGNLPQGANAPPGSGSNAAPGPIPATTPLVVRQDNNGVQWIAFEYSRDRVKMEYTIRCDVESVDTSSLSQEFKSENCVYPRACVPKDQYKGNRLNYESDCNQVGWALAELNACLRGKRGLIQRAVDSWRNSNQDVRLRSRRVRRQAKVTNKSRTSATAPPQTPGSARPPSTSVPSNSLPTPTGRAPGSVPSSSTSQQMHHHQQHDISTSGQDATAASVFSASQNIHRPGSTPQHMTSPNDLRHAQTFPGYQPYATAPTTLGPSMAPPLQGGMHQFGRPGVNTTMVSKEHHVKDEDDSALFGDVPEGKRRKFILVDDTQKNTRVRVKVTLDQIEMSEIPDSYRKHNSVFPRSYYPVQMQSAMESTAGNRFVEDVEEEVEDGFPTIGKTTVQCSMTDGNGEVEVPQLNNAKRGRERKINELGYRMAWGQSRVFSSRPIFLSRALDAYRTKQRTALTSSGQNTSSIPAHLETRPGKRRWLQRPRPNSQPSSPTQTTAE